MMTLWDLETKGLGLLVMEWAQDGDILQVVGSNLYAGHPVTVEQLEEASNYLLFMSKHVKYPELLTQENKTECNLLAIKLLMVAYRTKTDTGKERA